MPSVNVLRKVKLNDRWQMLPVAKVGERYDFSKVISGGQPVVVATGTFYLEWRGDDGRKTRRSAGTHPSHVRVAFTTQNKVLSLRRDGVKVEDAPQISVRREATGRSLAEALARHKSTAELQYTKRSRAKYLNAMVDFQEWASGRQLTHVIHIGREELVSYMGHVVTHDGLDHSTALDKGRIVHAVLNRQGADIRMKRGDWPRLTELEIETYEPATMAALLAAATPFEFALFQTFRMSGFREQEVGFLAWDDFKARQKTLSVTKKKTLGFAPKDKEERTIPIPDVLVDILVQHRKTLDAGSYLVFPTSTERAYRGCPGGQRDRHMLDKLKRLAYRARLNCGQCSGTRNKKAVTCATAPVCKNFGLHKFRHTYGTTLLRDGVDLISLQKILGHSDLESTKRYLKALHTDDLHAKIAQSTLSTKIFARAL